MLNDYVNRMHIIVEFTVKEEGFPGKGWLGRSLPHKVYLEPTW
jgi:hypothetical protein